MYLGLGHQNGQHGSSICREYRRVQIFFPFARFHFGYGSLLPYKANNKEEWFGDLFFDNIYASVPANTLLNGPAAALAAFSAALAACFTRSLAIKEKQSKPRTCGHTFFCRFCCSLTHFFCPLQYPRIPIINDVLSFMLCVTWVGGEGEDNTGG